MTKTNVPRLRFKGYNDNLEIKKVGDIFNVEDGDWIEKEFIHHEGKYRIIQTGNIGKSVFLPKDDNKKYLDDDGFKELKANLINPGDLLYCRLADPVGRSIVLPNIVEKCVTSVDVAILRNNKKTSPLYYQALFNSSKYLRMSDSLASGTTRKRISRKNLEKMNIIFPQMKEQERIGSFFAKIDNLIELQTQKLEQLKKLKQGYLQKMFPQDGESVPRLRFSGFSGEWKEERLEVILSERNEKIEENNEYPLMAFASNYGIIEKGDRYDRSALVKDDNKKYKITKYDDFIYSSNNFITGSIGLNKYGNATISPVYSIFYMKDNNNADFFDILSKNKSFIFKMKKYQQGVTYGQQRIKENDFLKIKIRIPSPNEQEKIGKYFELLNRNISKHENVLEQLKQQKKAYLQKMFI